jgi:hypothetical protein
MIASFIASHNKNLDGMILFIIKSDVKVVKPHTIHTIVEPYNLYILTDSATGIKYKTDTDTTVPV